MTDDRSQTNAQNAPISQYTRDKANRCRLSIESYYAQAMLQCADRDQRLMKLEQRMAQEGKLSWQAHMNHAMF
ncbi:Protein kinase domain containing protein [Aphelenchoides avenae]|nr:Protein kinase domain containing protein [Aphelenchus avenae]